MMKPIFILRNAWRHLGYHKYISIVVTATMCVGLMFPMIALNDVNDLIADGRLAAYAEPGRTMVIDLRMDVMERAKIDAALLDLHATGLFAAAGYSVLSRQIAHAGDEAYVVGVSGISEDYLALAGYELVAGDVFADGHDGGVGEKVCLLNHRDVLMRNGIGVGGIIQMMGEAYKVVGIVRAPRVYGGVIIPYMTAAELMSVRGGSFQYQVIVTAHGDFGVVPAAVAARLFPGEYVIAAETGTELEEQYYESVREVNQYRIWRAALVMAMAAINFTILLAGKMMSVRHALAVRLAVGAGHMTVAAEMMTANFILLAVSLLLCSLLHDGVAGLVSGANIFLLPATFFGVASAGALIVVIVSMGACLASLGKHRIAGLLDGK